MSFYTLCFSTLNSAGLVLDMFSTFPNDIQTIKKHILNFCNTADVSH